MNLTWTWNRARGPGAPARSRSRAVAAAGGGTLVYASPADGRPSIEKRGADREVVWRTELDRGTSSTDVAIAQHEGVVFVVQFPRIATGATLFALADDGGVFLWRMPLVGIGPTDHSQYQNDVDLRVAGDRVTVTGDESNGRYVEVRDTTTGALLASVVTLE